MTTFEALSIAIGVLGLLAAGASFLVADGRGRERSKFTEERVAKLDGLFDRMKGVEASADGSKDRQRFLEELGNRVTRLEEGAKQDALALERHFREDMAALARIDAGQDRLRTELLSAVGELRADIRARFKNDDDT